jgi:hypothetical protein
MNLRLKFWAAICSLVLAAIAFLTKSIGEGTLSLISAALLAIAATPTAPDAKPGDVLRQFRNEMHPRLIASNLVLAARYLFQFGDSVVRAIMIAIAIGGTVWIIKDSLGLNIIPDEIDVWIKRTGLALAIVAVIIFPSYLLSKRIYVMSAFQRDSKILTYEGLFYINVLVLCASIMVLFSGLPVETWPLVTSHPNPKEGSWKLEGAYQFWKSAVLISLVWSICFGVCLASRFFEWAWRDALDSRESTPAKKISPLI